jgi:hypothetical protein
MASHILRLIALGLLVEDVNWLVRAHEKAPQSLHFLYYPTLPSESDYNPEADIRAGAHSDHGSITLLFIRSQKPCLEILSPGPGGDTWTSVPIFPDNYHSETIPPIVVNIGDLLSYWTNGFHKSTDSASYQTQSRFILEPSTSHDFPDLPSFEMDPSEWAQWERLLSAQDSIAKATEIGVFTSQRLEQCWAVVITTSTGLI